MTDLSLGLQEAGLAISSNVHKLVHLGHHEVRVTWTNNAASSFYETDEGGFEQYRRMLRDQQFSVVLNDGALIQMSYDFRRDTLVRHRLAVLPCPIAFSLDELDDLTIDDFISICDREEIYKRARTRPYIRFDFNVDGPEHEPYSHMHTCYPESRLPVCGPISISQFAEFVFSNFYPEIWASQAWLSEIPVEYLPHRIRDEHLRRLHLTARNVDVARAC